MRRTLGLLCGLIETPGHMTRRDFLLLWLLFFYTRVWKMKNNAALRLYFESFLGADLWLHLFHIWSESKSMKSSLEVFFYGWRLGKKIKMTLKLHSPSKYITSSSPPMEQWFFLKTPMMENYFLFRTQTSSLCLFKLLMSLFTNRKRHSFWKLTVISVVQIVRYKLSHQK